MVTTRTSRLVAQILALLVLVVGIALIGASPSPARSAPNRAYMLQVGTETPTTGTPGPGTQTPEFGTPGATTLPAPILPAPPAGATPPDTVTPAATSTPLATATAVIAFIDDPAFAIAPDGQSHTIPGNAAVWYAFDYSGARADPRQIVFIRLTNGVQTGVQFEVWSGEYLKNWWLQKPVGRGNQEILINCYLPVGPIPTPVDDEPPPTEEPQTNKCPTNDLTWSGAFGANGTYYVRVINTNPAPQTFQLTIQ